MCPINLAIAQLDFWYQARRFEIESVTLPGRYVVANVSMKAAAHGP